MKEEKNLQEKFNLVQQELKTVTAKFEELEEKLKELEDLKLEIKGLKLFIGRVHPEFKAQLPELMKKVGRRSV